MDPDSEVEFEFVPVIRQYKSGRVERLIPENRVPPSVDPATGVESRDVILDPATGLGARLYLPGIPGPPAARLPIVVYVHGGSLVVGSAADAPEHAFLNRLCARARVLAVSVDYRLAPEHPVPACYDDAWTALQWALADPADDPWLRTHGDPARVSVLGFSAGGNIAHNVVLRAGGHNAKLLPAGASTIRGLVLVHPYFLAGADKTADEVVNAWLRRKLEETWVVACARRTPGLDDPRINPVAAAAPSLARLGCARVLVCLANDELKPRGRAYYDGLLGAGWEDEEKAADKRDPTKGLVGLLESAGEEHEFFLQNPTSAASVALMDRLVAFFGQQTTEASK